jgi:hypothetical protein
MDVAPLRHFLNYPPEVDLEYSIFNRQYSIPALPDKGYL